MTVISSLFSGISGIVANGSALSVAGDNIANMSTPAFKSSVPVFESALSQRIGEAEVGLGSRLAGTSANFTQGAFANTTRATDLAIQGKGFFIVQSTGGDRFYTRAGLFETDSNGKVVTSAGSYLLQGYSIDATTNQVSGTLSSVNFQSVSSAPAATTEIDFSLNLDADAPTKAAFDGTTFANAASTSNYSYSQTVYDSLGVPRSVTTYFRKSSTTANNWDFFTLTQGSNLANYEAGRPATGTVIIGSGTIAFNPDGTMASVTPNMTHAASGRSYEATTGNATDIREGEYVTAASPNGIQWVGANPAYGTPAAGATPAHLAIHHEFGQSGGSTARITQYASTESSIKSVVQNGRAQGELQSIEFLEDGTLRGNFSNGDSRDLYKIPIATFSNDNGLNRVGSNLYTETGTSGQAQVGLPGSAGRGALRSFAVEQSNVDLASEFVKIITFQRAFQASSRTVSTAAELLQDLVNLGK